VRLRGQLVVVTATVESFAVPVGSARTTGVLYRSTGARAALVLAHGAGAPQTHPWIVTMARALSDRGLDVLTFNFLYAEEKRRVPDRNDVLEATWCAAVAAVRARADVAHGRLYVGGKSMGGRIASQAAARAGVLGDIAGVVLLGYPLHPPGKPATLRTAHLPRVRAPMLFVQGSRDAFGTSDELAPIVKSLESQSPGTRLFVVEGADHSLSVRKSRARGAPAPAPTLDAVMTVVADEVRRFTA
jgi:hypothetical protein